MKRILIRILMITAMGCLFLTLTGCEDEASAPAPAPAKEVKPAQKVAATVAPEEPAPKMPEYVYSPAGQRDPFEELLQVKKSVAGDSVPLTPLQKFDLGQFRILGIIIGKGEPRAMVTAPGGKSFILKKGIKIGKNDGTVTKITPDGIHVEEKYYDFSGAVRTNPQVIKLPPRTGV
jgi:type IV pilus assembly protein PilP